MAIDARSSSKMDSKKNTNTMMHLRNDGGRSPGVARTPEASLQLVLNEETGEVTKLVLQNGFIKAAFNLTHPQLDYLAADYVGQSNWTENLLAQGNDTVSTITHLSFKFDVEDLPMLMLMKLFSTTMSLRYFDEHRSCMLMLNVDVDVGV